MKRGWNFLAALLVAAAVSGPAPAMADAEPDARQLLDAMATFLSSQTELRAELEVGYEVLQASGQKIEFGERRTLSLRRPAGLRVETSAGQGTGEVLVFDGHSMIVFDPSANVYAKTMRPGSLDDAIVHYVGDLGMRLPLAPLLLSTFPAELDSRVEVLAYVEKTDVFGHPAHHLAGRTATVDFEAWILEGKNPLLRRIALTYREEPGHPRFWANFSDWDFSPRLRDATFRFEAPEDAKEVSFAAELLSPTAATGGAQ